MNKGKVFAFLAWFVGIYHLLLGLAGIFGSQQFLEPIIKTVYGVDPTFNAQFEYLVKFIAVYFIAFGLMMVFVAMNPKQYAKFAWVAVVLFAIRIVQRLVFYNLLNEAFHISFVRNLEVLVPIAVIMVCLIAFHPDYSTGKKS